MSVNPLKVAVPTSGGIQAAVVLTFASMAYDRGLYAFLQLDDMGDAGALLVIGRTVGIKNGVVQFGSLIVTSAYDRRRVIVGDCGDLILVDGDTLDDEDRARPGIAIPMLVGLLDIRPAMSWLPMPFALPGDQAARDPQTGKPAPKKKAA